MGKFLRRKQLDRTVDDYLANKGWSSYKFYEHAKLVFTSLSGKVKFHIGRTVIHIETLDGNKKIKAYVHHNGRSNDWLTFTDAHGNELQSYHVSSPPEAVLRFVQNAILGEIPDK